MVVFEHHAGGAQVRVIHQAVEMRQLAVRDIGIAQQRQPLRGGALRDDLGQRGVERIDIGTACGRGGIARIACQTGMA
ncbi:hypothetical protein D3C81_2024310 [compost metagenome]